MRVYLLQRLAAMILTLLGVSLLIFAMIRLVPGTVVEQLLGQAAIASPEVLAAFRRFFGLDRPAHVQYLDWLAAVLRGDFGVSWLSGRPVLALFLERVPVSAELAVLAVAWSLVIGIPLGTASAVWRGGVRDVVIRVIATLGLSLPAFWQGTVLILLFSVYLGWMPSLQWVPFTRRPSVNLLTMALPALTLGTATAAMITRMSRSTMLDVLGREYVRTARAKGLPERRVTLHHALRNALIPVVTVAGGLFAARVAPFSPTAIDAAHVFQGPSPRHPFGTDRFGRDLLSRIVFGVRVSLGIAGASIALALAVGGVLGLLAGLGRGVDHVLGRAMDVFFAFPPVLLAIGIAAVLGAGPGTAVAAIAVVYAPRFFLVVRAPMLAVLAFNVIGDGLRDALDPRSAVR